MTRARPKLEVVPGGAGAASLPDRSEPAAAGETPRRSRLAGWALLVLLLVALAALVLENRRATGLATQVHSLENVIGELESELSAAEGAIAAHRSHLDDLRSFVAELSELVARDPEQAR